MRVLETTLLTGPYDWDERALPRGEFEGRLARVREAMAQAGAPAPPVPGPPGGYGAPPPPAHPHPQKGPARAPARRPLGDERQPRRGHVREVELDGTGDEHLSRDDLDLARREVVVRRIDVAGRERGRGDERGVRRRERHVARHDPVRPATTLRIGRPGVAGRTVALLGVEDERALSRSGDAADHGQLAVGNLAGDALQVMCPRAADDDGVVQWESTGREIFRPRHCVLRTVQGETGHLLL